MPRRNTYLHEIDVRISDGLTAVARAEAEAASHRQTVETLRALRASLAKGVVKKTTSRPAKKPSTDSTAFVAGNATATAA